MKKETKEKLINTSKWSLKQFADNECTELGEYWQSLIDLWHRRECAPKQLSELVRKEMDSQLEWCQNNLEFVHIIETREIVSTELRDKIIIDSL